MPDQQMPDGSWQPMKPSPEPFGVTWDRCWAARRRQGAPKWIALVMAWMDARSERREPTDA